MSAPAASVAVKVDVNGAILPMRLHLHRDGFGAARLVLGGCDVKVGQDEVLRIIDGLLLVIMPTEAEAHARAVVAETLGMAI